jgi:hypothetical protein
MDFARLRLPEVEVEIRQLGKVVAAGPDSLPTFGHSEDLGRPHIEVDQRGYHYIVVERGREQSRLDTTSLDALLFRTMVDVTFGLSCQYELAHRVEGKDSRRILFAHQLELLGLLSTNWQSRMAIELDAILERHPFDDVASVRAQYAQRLRSTGVTPDAAWAQALVEYPAPHAGPKKE